MFDEKKIPENVLNFSNSKEFQAIAGERSRLFRERWRGIESEFIKELLRTCSTVTKLRDALHSVPYAAVRRE